MDQRAEPWDWVGAGLRFQCRGCGACCSGEPGAVWVDDEEIAQLAAALALSAEVFEHEYVRRSGLRRRLYEWPDGDCVLFDRETRRCRGYAARPRQCRAWPFWPAHLRSTASWAEVASQCPGCDEGTLHGPARVAELVSLFARSAR